MRLLATLKTEEEARTLSNALTQEKIENQVEAKLVTDWGSNEYGTPEYFIWVIDEDQVEAASHVLQEYQANPENPRYQTSKIVPIQETKIAPKGKTSKAPLTLYLIAICSFLFAWDSITSPELNSAKIYMSPVKQDLLYDFPQSFQILEKLVKQYGIEALKTPEELPPKGAALVHDLRQHPYWEGGYERLLVFLTQGTFPPEVPLFEKIRQGEIWRIFTPIFLHADIFHLLFNMLWLYVLGRQLEVHLKPVRYLLFIALAAAVTNTAQYLMGGPSFLGISGVLCAMLTYIWKRQNDAPWEGYQLQRSTFLFMMIFLFGMLGLQMLSFTLEVATGTVISTSIANTAHISGIVFGILLASIPYFTKEAS